MRPSLGEKVHYLPGARRVAGFLLFGLLAGCSGGGGGDQATETQISTNAIAFSAVSPSAESPAAQTFTATFGDAIAQLSVIHSGDAIASTTSVLNGRTAQITVVPAAPSAIGPGPFVGAVAVTGYTCADTSCSRLAAGSTATVSVEYQVSPLIQSVAPYIGTAGVSDTVLIRGVGLRAFNVSGVRFGDTAATAFTVNTTGTELLATHPALTAGNYTVTIDASNHTGVVPSNVLLRVLDPVAYATATLDHVPSTTGLRTLIYDAERQALLTVTDTPPSNPVVRYQYSNGAWSAPAQSPAALFDAALSSDGTQLFGITASTLQNIDPVTLALGAAVDAPSLATDSFLKNIVVGNDNRALLTTSLPTSGSTQGYLYDPPSATLLLNGLQLNNATPTMAAGGSVAVVSQGDPTLTADVPVYLYSTSTNTLTASSVSLRQNAVAPAVNRAGTRIVLNGLRVYDSNLALLGTLPDTTEAVVLNSTGTRAYTLDSTAGGILVFDTSVDRDEAAYVALGPVTPVAAALGSGVRMIITPDNGTLFLGGSARIVVQPAPAL